VRLSYNINSRHVLSVLYAPLTLESDGRIPVDISFAESYFLQTATLMPLINSIRTD